MIGLVVTVMHLQKKCRLVSFMSHQLQPLLLHCGAMRMHVSQLGIALVINIFLFNNSLQSSH
jgi:hypothetical protein